MPDIRKLPDDSEEKCYKIKVGNTDICFLSTDIIEYEGVKYTGEELYAKITN